MTSSPHKIAANENNHKRHHRKKPGATGEGEYYHVTIRPKEQFIKFRTQDVGENEHSYRVAGQRPSGTWDTQKWMLYKEDAFVENGYLHSQRPKTKNILNNLGSVPRRVKGDIFKAKP